MESISCNTIFVVAGAILRATRRSWRGKRRNVHLYGDNIHISDLLPPAFLHTLASASFVPLGNGYVRDFSPALLIQQPPQCAFFRILFATLRITRLISNLHKQIKTVRELFCFIAVTRALFVPTAAPSTRLRTLCAHLSLAVRFIKSLGEKSECDASSQLISLSVSV